MRPYVARILVTRGCRNRYTTISPPLLTIFARRTTPAALGSSSVPGYPASGKVIEFLDIAEVQTGTLFQISDLIWVAATSKASSKPGKFWISSCPSTNPVADGVPSRLIRTHIFQNCNGQRTSSSFDHFCISGHSLRIAGRL